ncbi:Chromate transporter [Jeotgalicoccus saudimassiliensis]|uniref:Chromate transporter n=2 Tax=Jeotgalicoccus saudimassiliensis TaxID=1461582 RepID=A0A078M6D1_9STAP|nr:Chromate transporter [Jeotgalicoccus saudimassiliensis]
MDDEEFSNVLALGNSLPGPIATKMAGYIGYKVGGFIGLIVALFATIMPTVIIMIFLIGTLSNFRDSTYVQGMTAAITPVITVMMFILTYQFLFSSKKNLGEIKTLILLSLSFIAYIILDIHPAIIILVIIIYSFIKYRK